MSKIRVPPHNLVAEQAVLSCEMLGGGKVDVVRGIIDPDDFFSEVHQIIQRTILAVADARDGDVDIILVMEKLASEGNLDDVGGEVYIREILDQVYYSDHAAHYAGLVADCSRRRKAIAIGEELIDKSHDMSCDLKEIAEAANDSAVQIAESLNAKSTRPRLLSDHVSEAWESAKSGKKPTVFWGIPQIDSLIGGVALGELVVIGARPSAGKSLIGMQWLDMASAQGIPGIMISEEMTAKNLAERTLSYITCLSDSERLADTGRMEFDIREHFANRAPVLIAEKCETIAGAERAVARAVQSHGIKIVCIDYAQILKGKGDVTHEQIADVSSRSKALAMKHEIIVMLLAQLNREVEKRPGAEPNLSDFKGSGSLEQDADIALFPFWPFKHDNSKDPSDYQIYVRKNRNRGIGNAVVQLKINPARQRLEATEEPDDWDRR